MELASFCRETLETLQLLAETCESVSFFAASIWLFLGNRAFWHGVFLLQSATLDHSQRQLDGQGHPFVDQFAQLTIVLQLAAGLLGIVVADKLRSALSLPGEADLVIRAVLDGRRRFAPARRITADVVLLR